MRKFSWKGVWSIRQKKVGPCHVERCDRSLPFFCRLPLKRAGGEVEVAHTLRIGDFQFCLLDGQDGQGAIGARGLIDLQSELAGCQIFTQDAEDACLWILSHRAGIDGDECGVDLQARNVGGVQDAFRYGQRAACCERKHAEARWLRGCWRKRWRV